MNRHVVSAAPGWYVGVACASGAGIYWIPVAAWIVGYSLDHEANLSFVDSAYPVLAETGMEPGDRWLVKSPDGTMQAPERESFEDESTAEAWLRTPKGAAR